MPKKESFTTSIICPRCGSSGTAIWEENENPVHGSGLDAKLVEVSGKFKIINGYKIKCKDCGELI